MFREIFQVWRRRSASASASKVRQSGAMPYCVIDGRIVFLLVTTRRTGRWIFPKGGIVQDMTPWDSAAKEALEEAGVSGTIGTTPIGTYYTSDKGQIVPVDLYPLEVEQQFDSWKEMDQRLRHWALPAEAQRLIADWRLSRIPVSFHRQLMRQKNRQSGKAGHRTMPPEGPQPGA
jgi:8-oxo-dGTP pyrophosphatase MutT (NUDIX family)